MIALQKAQSVNCQKISIFKFYELFPTDDICLDFYFKVLFLDKNCTKCGRSVIENYNRISRKNNNGVPKKAYRCRSCKTYIYPLSNTVFRQSTIPLTSIFSAIFTFCISRSSHSAIDMVGRTNVTYKTAHKLMMLIRMTLFPKLDNKMKGIIEVDEAFLGKGSSFNNWGGICTKKQIIIGLRERETKQVRMYVVPNRSSKTIHKLIKDNVEFGSTIYTDSWRGYNGLSEKYIHETVDHSKKEFVRGDVHTNGIESAWSYLKRNIRKAHIKITDKYIQLYLNEAMWRHNSKDKSTMQLFSEILKSSSFSPIISKASSRITN